MMKENIQRHSPKSLVEAYLLWLPFGLFGFHHFYLGNTRLGVAYLCTLGFFGIGWILDAFLMPHHVRSANYDATFAIPHHLDQVLVPLKKQTYLAFLLAIWPLSGILGGHHYYLRRPWVGVFYTLTLGVCGVGYLVDWIRTPFLVKRTNKLLAGEIPARQKFLDDAYLYWFPFGILGLHHFYLNRPGWGVLYFLTFGFFGIGWLVDFVRLPGLVRQYNNGISNNLLCSASTPSEPYQGYSACAPTNVSTGYQTAGSSFVSVPSAPCSGTFPDGRPPAYATDPNTTVVTQGLPPPPYHK